MAECNKTNVKLSDLQLNKLKSAVKNKQDLTLKEIIYLINYY